ncbi:MAG: SpoIIE family protein phosphatase [Spirochaetes bacterium]|nr:SpoIIE family protein phosphatase [Spirochaetota bacterium]
MNRRRIFILLLVMLPAWLHAAVTVPRELSVPLDIADARGEWRFMGGDDPAYRLREYDDSSWETVASMPHNWKDRRVRPHESSIFGWYRIHLSLGKVPPDRQLMLRLGPIDDADETYFNGILIGRTGAIDAAGRAPRRHAWDRVRLYPLPCGALRQGDNVLAVRVQSYFDDFAGMYYDGGRALLGYEIDLLHDFFAAENVSLLVFVVVIIAVGLYCLLLYARRPVSRENLFFGCSCLLFGVYFTLSSALKNFLPFDFMAMKRIEYICLFPVLCMFVDYLYAFFYNARNGPGRWQRYLLVFNNAVALVSMLVPIVFTDYMVWWWYFGHVVVAHWAFCFLQILWIIAENMARRNRDAFYLLAGVILAMVTLVNDVLSIYAVLPWGRFGHIGYFVFIIFLGVVLANRYVRTQREIERLNVGLERLVEERTGELMVVNDSLVERTRELSEAYGALRERNVVMEEELEIARLIMEKVLPRSSPEKRGYRCHMAHIPMDKVGGDFYHYCDKGDVIELMVADVSGHGLPGAFLSLITKMALEGVTAIATPSQMMSHLNDAVFRATVKSNYITSFLCVINARTNVMSYCNAGHLPALLYRPVEGDFIELQAKGNPLGLFGQLRVEEKSLRLRPGERLVLFTDGIIECRASGGEMYGTGRLKDFIVRTAGETPGAFADILVGDLRAFAGTKGFEDDLTLVVLDVL